MSGLLLGALLLGGVAGPSGAADPGRGSAQAREERASTLTWTLRVDGVERVLAGAEAVELPGSPWRCGVSFRRVQQGDAPATTTGTLSCRAERGGAAHTLVMCEERPGGSPDRGAGTLLLGAGAATTALELGCHGPGAEPAPRLNLEPGTQPGDRAGLPAERLPPRPGVYRWQLEEGGDTWSLPSPDPLPEGAQGWRCAATAGGVEDPALGYAEYGSLVCTRGELRATTIVPCVRNGPLDHACQAGSLLLDGPDGSQDRYLLLCEDVGNPGCF